MKQLGKTKEEIEELQKELEIYDWTEALYSEEEAVCAKSKAPMEAGGVLVTLINITHAWIRHGGVHADGLPEDVKEDREDD